MEIILEVVNHRKQTGKEAELLAIFQNGERAWGNKKDIWNDGKKLYKKYLEDNNIDTEALHVEDKKDDYFKKIQKKKAATNKLWFYMYKIGCRLVKMMTNKLFHIYMADWEH
jgi:hypothetical protein